MSFRIHQHQPEPVSDDQIDPKAKVNIAVKSDPSIAVLHKQMADLQAEPQSLKSQIQVSKPAQAAPSGLVVPTRAAFSYSPCASPRR